MEPNLVKRRLHRLYAPIRRQAAARDMDGGTTKHITVILKSPAHTTRLGADAHTRTATPMQPLQAGPAGKQGALAAGACLGRAAAGALLLRRLHSSQIAARAATLSTCKPCMRTTARHCTSATHFNIVLLAYGRHFYTGLLHAQSRPTPLQRRR